MSWLDRPAGVAMQIEQCLDLRHKPRAETLRDAIAYLRSGTWLPALTPDVFRPLLKKHRAGKRFTRTEQVQLVAAVQSAWDTLDLMRANADVDEERFRRSYKALEHAKVADAEQAKEIMERAWGTAAELQILRAEPRIVIESKATAPKRAAP